MRRSLAAPLLSWAPMTHASQHLTLADIARHLDVDFEGD
ncbi:MAG TPA: UDP-3-O-(3-hydroxymyristoyl)glucosamine N-acyltransferase, partial [Halomonas sp.]|nr:UDP-3-O-(3-hydroxymyristoyl)glucosamine N-acyltransferase [Halomonas sp.]